MRNRAGSRLCCRRMVGLFLSLRIHYVPILMCHTAQSCRSQSWYPHHWIVMIFRCFPGHWDLPWGTRLHCCLLQSNFDGHSLPHYSHPANTSNVDNVSASHIPCPPQAEWLLRGRRAAPNARVRAGRRMRIALGNLLATHAVLSWIFNAISMLTDGHLCLALHTISQRVVMLNCQVDFYSESQYLTPPRYAFYSVMSNTRRRTRYYATSPCSCLV